MLNISLNCTFYQAISPDSRVSHGPLYARYHDIYNVRALIEECKATQVTVSGTRSWHRETDIEPNSLPWNVWMAHALQTEHNYVTLLQYWMNIILLNCQYEILHPERSLDSVQNLLKVPRKSFALREFYRGKSNFSVILILFRVWDPYSLCELKIMSYFEIIKYFTSKNL
jgi:hypothetical protein